MEKQELSETVSLTSIVCNMSDPNIYICDFNDSFTYNIYSELKLIDSELVIEVVPFSKVEVLLLKLQNIERKTAIIMGPGPGSPTEYSFLFEGIHNVSLNKNIFLMGICLGHQLYWSSQKYSVIKCGEPVHGQTQRYSLPKPISHKLRNLSSIEVQRYNSLKVDLSSTQEEELTKGKGALIFDRELVMYISERLVTYQFHPESVGTKNSEVFFSHLLSYLG